MLCTVRCIKIPFERTVFDRKTANVRIQFERRNYTSEACLKKATSVTNREIKNSHLNLKCCVNTDCKKVSNSFMLFLGGLESHFYFPQYSYSGQSFKNVFRSSRSKRDWVPKFGVFIRSLFYDSSGSVTECMLLYV